MLASTQSRRSGFVRVVLELRVSTDHQENSLDSQRTELTRLIDNRPDHRIVAEYVDEAINGDDTERRTGFLQMRDDAEAGRFDLVLVWDQDRFGRFDLIDGGHYIRPFRQARVQLETIAQGVVDWEDFTGQLIYSVNQIVKAQFLRDLSRNTTRGLIAAAREGRAGTGGPSPFGYRSKGGKVWIVGDEAKIVRLVFRLYLKPGGSLRGVVAELNRLKIKAPRGGIWRISSVRAILQRRKYCGTFVYGDQNGGKYFAMRDGEVVPRRKSDGVTKSEPIVHPDRFEAIIDQKAFDQAQAKLNSRKNDTAPKTTRQYLLTGLVHCGDCGGGMGGRTASNQPLYECRTYNQTGASECNRNTIPEAPLVSVISQKIQDRYLSEPALDRLRKKIESNLAKADQAVSASFETRARQRHLGT
jgi:site-specific DNA recombinase